MRRWVPEAVKGVLREVRGWLPAPPLTARHPLLVLTYHRVLPREAFRAAPFPELCVPVEHFAAQLRALEPYYRFLPLGEAVAAWASGGGAVAAVTFDDGYGDNHAVALPVLRALGIPATVFLVTAHIGTDRPLWFDEAALRLLGAPERWRALAPKAAGIAPEAAGALCGGGSPRGAVYRFVQYLKGLPEEGRGAVLALLRRELPVLDPRPVRLLTWAEVAALREAGWEVGAHTRTHALLPGLPEERLRAEVAGARDDLVRRLGERPRAFAYPNGDPDARVVRAVGDAGYALAVTTLGGPNTPATPRLALRRVFVGPRSGRGAGGRFAPRAFLAEVARG